MENEEEAKFASHHNLQISGGWNDINTRVLMSSVRKTKHLTFNIYTAVRAKLRCK